MINDEDLGRFVVRGCPLHVSWNFGGKRDGDLLMVSHLLMWLQGQCNT